MVPPLMGPPLSFLTPASFRSVLLPHYSEALGGILADCCQEPRALRRERSFHGQSVWGPVAWSGDLLKTQVQDVSRRCLEQPICTPSITCASVGPSVSRHGPACGHMEIISIRVPTGECHLSSSCLRTLQCKASSIFWPPLPGVPSIAMVLYTTMIIPQMYSIYIYRQCQTNV